MRKGKILKGTVVLLIAVAMVFSTVAIAENTKETSKIGEEVQCNPSIDVEKYVWVPKYNEWIDADHSSSALPVPICNNVTFKIVIHNDGDVPLYDLMVGDRMPYDFLNFTSSDPEPYDWFYDPPYLYIRWYFPEPLMPCETINVTIIAHVEGPIGITDCNFGFGEGFCEHGTVDRDEDLCYIRAVKKSREINTPFLNFLQNHPNLFPFLQMLLQRLGLQ